LIEDELDTSKTLRKKGEKPQNFTEIWQKLSKLYGKKAFFGKNFTEHPRKRAKLYGKLSETLRRWNENSVAVFLSVTLRWKSARRGGNV
jgi:hypothetical protein